MRSSMQRFLRFSTIAASWIFGRRTISSTPLALTLPLLCQWQFDGWKLITIQNSLVDVLNSKILHPSKFRQHSRIPNSPFCRLVPRGVLYTNDQEEKMKRKQNSSSAEKREKYLRMNRNLLSSEVMFSFGAHDHNYSPYTDEAGFEF